MTDRPRPMELADRALGPDLARGFMLVFIALANAHFFLTAPVVLGGYPQDGTAVDSAVTWLLATFVDGRSFPMFGVLFGYGVAQIVRRQQGRPPRVVRRLLWRRSLVLIVVGFLHAVLLFAGDILTAYGVMLLFGAWLIRWRDRSLLAVAVAGLLLIFGLSWLAPIAVKEPPGAALLPPDLTAILTERPLFSVVIALLGPVVITSPFAIGLWAGRRRILEHPQEQLGLLRVTGVGGLATAVLGAQPVALVLAGAIDLPDGRTVALQGALHATSGVLGGIGYAALFALLAIRLQGNAGPLITAIAATGQRSMTCYLAQSVVWTIVFTPFLLDLSAPLGVATTAVLSVATWALTVVLADWMRRTGRRGPFESLVRRVSYRQGTALRAAA